MKNSRGFVMYTNENGKVIYAVNYDSSNIVTLYPYIRARYGGLDNCSGELTVAAVKARQRRGTIWFR